MERYFAIGMPLLSPAQNNSSNSVTKTMIPLNFDEYTNYDAYASSVVEDSKKISLPDIETSNKEFGDLQEDGEDRGNIDDHGVTFIATGN